MTPKLVMTHLLMALRMATRQLRMAARQLGVVAMQLVMATRQLAVRPLAMMMQLSMAMSQSRKRQ